MLKHPTFLTAALLALGLSVNTVYAEEPETTSEPTAEAKINHSANTVIAVVNGEDITLGHLILAQAALPEQYRTLPDDVLFNLLIEQLIQQTVLKQQLHGEVPQGVKFSIDNQSRSLLAGEVISRIMASSQDEDAIYEAYEARYSTHSSDNEFNASHILVETEERAKEVKAELDSGVDFEVMAKSSSIGPSGPNGGALGWFGTGQMVPEFENAVLEMRSGDISNPVQTQFGWHVIKLNDRRKISAPEFDEVREQLAQEIAQQAVEDRLSQLTTDAEVERPEIENFDPAVMRDLTIVQQ